MYPVPEEERDRLVFLTSSALIGKPAEREFDEVARLAAELYGAPIALVTLVGQDDQWFHGRTGLSADGTCRKLSFCAHTIAGDRPFIIRDAASDRRFCDNPLVTGEPHIRFYAGVPITTREGLRLGAVCILDRHPRPEMSDHEVLPLVRLARMVARRLEARKLEHEGRAVGGFAEAAALAIVTTDAVGTITAWNAAAEHLFGYPRDHALGCSLDLIIPERFRAAHGATLAHAARGGATKLTGQSVEVTARRADGNEVQVELSVATWQGPAGVCFGAHVQDVSARRAREAALQHLAAHDQLTGLLNPKAFQRNLRDRLASDEGAALLVCDLDGFKTVNDSLGHAVGDALLQALAVRLRSVAGADWLIGRLGGDEFAVLLPAEADVFAARDAAAALLSTFRSAFNVGGHRLHLAVSIGVALAPDHAADAEDLMMRADLAMFRAKRCGGHSYRLFDSSMQSELAARQAFNEELRQAQLSGQWELFYQPQVSLVTGQLVGAEALLRWRHPRWGVLSPATFMPVLETHCVAFEVGQWVLNESCRQLAAWRASGVHVPRMSCNLFGAQVHARDLVEQVEDALSCHGLDPSDLELEITETIALRHDDDKLQPLFKLVNRGVGVALDDFGTGFASLSTLKRAPLTRLKIDRSFVADMNVDRHSAAVIGGILSIGKALDIEVIAEGIETPEQSAALATLGCVQGQGYLFGRPVDGAAFAETYGRFPSQPLGVRANN